MRDFIHLSTHSIYSRCYSTATVEDIVDKAVSLGMPGVALTDKANMMGVMVFSNIARKSMQLAIPISSPSSDANLTCANPKALI